MFRSNDMQQLSAYPSSETQNLPSMFSSGHRLHSFPTVKNPAPQTQNPLDTDPPSAVVFRSGHSEQPVDALVLLKKPKLQRWQLLAPVPLLAKPSSHGIHCPTAAGRTNPGGHSTHSRCPFTSTHSPPKHSHLPSSVAEHGKHPSSDSERWYPTGHNRHLVAESFTVRQ